MKNEQITVRLEQHIIEDLKDEAKKRGQPLATLARTFIRDGLARYDAISEQLLQTGERIEARLQTIEALAGANLHVAVERQILPSEREPGEADDAYIDRLRANYTTAVLASIPKGLLIAQRAVELKKSETGKGKR